MECNVCLESYDEGNRRPRNLPCGHSFCTRCITNVLKDGKVSCPSCRTDHRAMAATEFPFNFELEKVISLLKGARTAQAAGVRPRQAHMRGLSQKMKVLIEEQKDSLSHMDHLCQSTDDQLAMYEYQLDDWLDEHQKILNKLNSLVDENKTVMALLENEKTKIHDQKKASEMRKQERQTLQECLTIVTTTQEAAVSIDEAEASNMAAEDWVQKCQHDFPNVHLVRSSMKVRKIVMKSLAAADEETTGVEPAAVGHSSSSILEKLRTIAEGPTALSAVKLRPLQEPVKAFVTAGRLVAVHQDQNRLRHSQFTYSDNRLHLHTLSDQPRPAQAITVKHGAVMGLLDPSSTLAFLDLSWGGSVKGRVYIRLSPNTGLARQFMMLCTGQRGPSYRNTRFFYVYDKGGQNERLAGGDYEKDTGEGGAAVLPGLKDGPEYTRPIVPGSVASLHRAGHNRSALFCIITGTGGSMLLNTTFGQVESGLQVVKAAAKHSNVRDVKIADCGIVLPQ